MDPNQCSSGALIDQANATIAQLLRRFENIVALAPVAGHDRSQTAVECYQVEVETAALIRAAEDTLSLSRLLKEMWLFGQLDTIGETAVEAKTEEHARAVAEGLKKIIERETMVMERKES